MDEELATRRLEQEPATRRMESRPAPSAPPPRRARPAQPQQPPKRRPSVMRRAMRSVGALILLLLIAAAVAIGVIAATSKSTGVKLREIGGDTIQKASDELKGLVEDNKK